MQTALRRTACVSDVALEVCDVAVQVSRKPQEHDVYHDLLDREEQKLDEAFAAMKPGELPGEVVAAAEVWLDNAYDNITLAQACLAVRSRRERKRVEVCDVHPEPPDGETSAERARRLLSPRGGTHTAKRPEGESSERRFEPKQRQSAFSRRRPKPVGQQVGRT